MWFAKKTRVKIEPPPPDWWIQWTEKEIKRKLQSQEVFQLKEDDIVQDALPLHHPDKSNDEDTKNNGIDIVFRTKPRNIFRKKQ
jgi:hypothetical protein